MYIQRDQDETMEGMLISANLNSTMLFNFLMGIYTVVYAWTVYLSVTRRGTSLEHRVVLYIITVLYVLCVCLFALYWYSLNLSLVKHGGTRETASVASIIGPRALSMSINALEGTMLIVADGLLIWRCFRIYDRSRYVVSAMMVLLATEIGIGITTTFTRLQTSTNPRIVKIINTLIPTGLLLSATVTFMSTSLIAYRIYRNSLARPSDGLILSSTVRFTYVIRILFESAAVYSVVAIANAIVCAVVPSIREDKQRAMVLETGDYLESLTYIVAGMAPTILVAKVVTADDLDVEEEDNTIGSDFEVGPQCPSDSASECEEDNAESTQHTESIESMPSFETAHSGRL